ncbi:TetR/AcrR family transcriptional regulator [Amycolatopsis suaedae]|uniref:TetR/AcrR family transcriptional regulator n=1 Tax=Amycolatopsis suaedae TaxID=2510978 RepID=UPI0013EEF0C4|nr:TetR/AcrR family transcriptional regulator [Amycolatopsis suaedae]
MSSTRNRTRAHILKTAASVLADCPTASLGDVAEKAGVGRSTLHRYFPERSGLTAAVVDEAIEQIRLAVTEAALDRDDTLTALRRAVHAWLEIGPWLQYLFNTGHLLAEQDRVNQELDSANKPLTDLLERGRKEGLLDAGVTVDWLMGVFWALLYTGWELAKEGTLPRHDVAANIIRTMENGIMSR